MKYDVIIVGSGVAGLYCALHLPQTLRVLVLCKERANECNTCYAQGGISVALDEEDSKLHINDSLGAGSHLNNPSALEILSKESLRLIEDLDKLGIKVDRDCGGKILYAKEGGHQRARIVHFDGDGSGKFLHQHLLKRQRHTLWEDSQVLDLIIEGDVCFGVILKKKNKILRVWANHVILASGGIGGLFTYHTNARTLSADLHGIILKHSLKLKDMEMLQFHPTAYTQARSARKPLISEAVRGEGGRIVDSQGKQFLFDYDKRGELAPRDIVARGIFEYCLETKEQAFLDLSSFSQDNFMQRFPNIFRSLRECGLNPPEELVPISPAFHYCMGGIEVGLESRVVGMRNLYAIGECANNGVHGANRLASNSLLEGLVFGKRVVQEVLNSQPPNQKQVKKIELPKLKNLFKDKDLILKNHLRQVMWDKVGIVRTKAGLQEALKEIEKMANENIGEMFALRLRVAKEIIDQALKREKSLGAHFIKDDA